MSDHPVSPYHAALTCTCPHCGKGKLYRAYLKIAPKCNHCGFDLSAEDTADGPAVFLIFILGFIITPLAVWFGLVTDWSPAWQALLWTVVTTVLTLALLPSLKAYTVALQYKHLREGRDRL